MPIALETFIKNFVTDMCDLATRDENNSGDRVAATGHQQSQQQHHQPQRHHTSRHSNSFAYRRCALGSCQAGAAQGTDARTLVCSLSGEGPNLKFWGTCLYGGLWFFFHGVTCSVDVVSFGGLSCRANFLNHSSNQREERGGFPHIRWTDVNET